MLTSKFVFAASLALATTSVLADSGDLNINDWLPSNSTITREQVKQEMRDAYARGESPSASPSRAEVKAELREATRLGLVSIGEGDVPVATAEQESMIAKAGHDAAEQLARSTTGSEG
jgi:hypothetical protein